MIPLIELPEDLILATAQRLEPWVRVSTTQPSRCGVAVDVHKLSAQQRWLVDEGALLPDWAYHWLTLAAELAYSGAQRNLGSVLIYPNTKKALLLPLETTEVAEALGSGAFRHEAGVLLAWGVPTDALAKMNNPHWPVPCLGVVASVVDGMGMLCLAAVDELSRISAWVQRR